MVKKIIIVLTICVGLLLSACDSEAVFELDGEANAEEAGYLKSSNSQNIKSSEKQQKDGFNDNTLVKVGDYNFLVPTYWSADIAEEDHFRAHANDGYNVILNILAEYDEEDPVTYDILVKDTESGEMSKAFKTWFEDCDEIAIKEFDNGNIKGFVYETLGTINGNEVFFNCLCFPDEKNNKWIDFLLVEATENEKRYTDDFYKTMNSISVVDSLIKKMTDEAETAYSNVQVEGDIPVFNGASLDDAIKKAADYGVIKQYDGDFGHGTRCVSLSDSSGGLMLDIIFVEETKEIMSASITTNKLSTTSEQKSFVETMAPVLCPSVDSSEVTKWVKENIGGNKKTIIGGFTYEVSLGPVDNIIYSAGNDEWEEWDISQDK